MNGSGGGPDMARIEHLALWTHDIGRSAAFYVNYFGASAGNRYVNASKGFESCFLSFGDGARLEVMKTTALAPVAIEAGAQRMGLTHFALSVGSERRVDELTRRLANDGYQVLDGPRRTGDGYYESVVLDPDGNRVEIAAS
jgi:lactoylglutathione lyase